MRFIVGCDVQYRLRLLQFYLGDFKLRVTYSHKSCRFIPDNLLLCVSYQSNDAEQCSKDGFLHIFIVSVIRYNNIYDIRQ